ncbi:uncharacterized protein LOC125946443 [Dermacentor silvarum]|uniref:uncharacterized protein LOC125946443 n=1 Tax=Dermacentor silvarum TaxID=543639 RepID=UPI002101CDD9|nr:uncharacterized protein LOC125946443 [Dermacentor silvarum]
MKRVVAMIVITLLLGLALGHGHHDGGKKKSHVVLVQRPVYKPGCFDEYGHGGHQGGYGKTPHGHGNGGYGGYGHGHGGYGHGKHGGHQYVPYRY